MHLAQREGLVRVIGEAQGGAGRDEEAGGGVEGELPRCLFPAPAAEAEERRGPPGGAAAAAAAAGGGPAGRGDAAVADEHLQGNVCRMNRLRGVGLGLLGYWKRKPKGRGDAAVADQHLCDQEEGRIERGHEARESFNKKRVGEMHDQCHLVVSYIHDIS